MKNILILVLLFAAAGSYAQINNVQFINPSTLSSPKGYSHAAIIDLGTCNMVIMSGQVPLDSTGNFIGKGDFTLQAETVFANIKKLVIAAGGNMDNVVKLGYFVLDVSQLQTLRTVRDRFVNTQHPPASTLVQVSKLFRDDVLLEVEATAIIPKK